MLRLTSKDGMAIHHLADKARKKISLYAENKAAIVNVPFLDNFQNKIRYIAFWWNETEKDWGSLGAYDDPYPIRYLTR